MSKIQSLHVPPLDGEPSAAMAPMAFSELRTLLREDFTRHHGEILSPGFHTVAIYRLIVWTDRLPNLFVRYPLRRLFGFVAKFLRSFHGIELPSTAQVGRRLLLAHQSGIVIGGGVVIGDDCLIRQNVTLGAIGCGGPTDGCPTIGDRVEFGAGAVVFGPVIIGDDCLIGPNVVVRDSLPAGSIAAPARPDVRRRGGWPMSGAPRKVGAS